LNSGTRSYQNAIKVNPPRDSGFKLNDKIERPFLLKVLKILDPDNDLFKKGPNDLREEMINQLSKEYVFIYII